MKQLNIRSHLRRFMAAALAGVLAVSLSVNAFAAESSFSDVPSSHAFHDAITWCADQGIVGGYTDGTFQPAKTVTRSNFTVMLSRAFYADEVAKYNNAVNLQYGTFYPNFVAMRYNGILEGTSFSTMDAIQNISTMNKGIARYDMAQLMTNIMNAKGFSASSADKDNAISKIADYTAIPSQYKDAVANVYALGIIGGYSDGTFGGDITMNRGQAAIVIYRMMQFSGNSGAEAGTTTTETLSTPTVPAPIEPETPTTPATLTLRDGSAVTEVNVLNRIQAIMKDYPAGTPWGSGSAGARNNQATVGGYTLGSLSSTLSTISSKYNSQKGGSESMSTGCGGFAGLVSDAIFGGGNNGGNDFPGRKLTSISQVRPGDIVIRLNADGKVIHVMAAASTATMGKLYQGIQFYEFTAYHGGGYNGGTDGTVLLSPSTRMSDDLCQGEYYEAWTRYPDPTEPTMPTTPTTPATLTLRDGSAVTEDNALKIIEQIEQVYPAGTTWDKTTARLNNIEISGRKLGTNSSAVATIGRAVSPTSMGYACGGFAGLVSDAIFGGGDNGGNNFPARKLDSVSQVRPGDIVVRRDANGKTIHVMAATSNATISKVYQGVQFYEITKYDGNSNSSVSISTINISDDLCRGEYYEAWTRYPV